MWISDYIKGLTFFFLKIKIPKGISFGNMEAKPPCGV